MKFIIPTISVLSVTLSACGGGSDSATAPPKKAKTAVPQMSISPASGSVADPKYAVAKNSYSSPVMHSANTIGSTDIKGCIKALNLFNIYSSGWNDEFNEELSPKQKKNLKGFYGVYGANGIVDYTAHSKEMIEAKDWISYFYYDANYQDCAYRRYKSDAKVNKVGKDITELRHQYSVDAARKRPQLHLKNYTAWQSDTEKKTVIGLVATSITGATQSKQLLKSFSSDSERIVDTVSFSDMFRNSYFLESYNNGEVEYQVVGGKVIDRYLKSNQSAPKTYYAVNLISAYFPGFGTRVNWCVRGSPFVSNKETPISEVEYNSIIAKGDLGLAYCDPFDTNISQVRYYDTKGSKVSDSSAIALKLNNKLVRGTIVKDKLDQRVENKNLYLGKTYSEFFQDTSLANQVDQIKSDLTK